jgi:hypothetical protein
VPVQSDSFDDGMGATGVSAEAGSRPTFANLFAKV